MKKMNEFFSVISVKTFGLCNNDLVLKRDEALRE